MEKQSTQGAGISSAHFINKCGENIKGTKNPGSSRLHEEKKGGRKQKNANLRAAKADG
jgi:hypothetical protein